MESIKTIAKRALPQPIQKNTLKKFEQCLKPGDWPPCDVCGYADNVHAAWCDAIDIEADICPTCNSPFGQPGYLRNDNAADMDNFGKLHPCPDCYDVEIKSKVESQIKGLDQKTFDNFAIFNETSQHGLDAAKRFADSPTGWLTLYGEHGPGKTHLVAAIANRIGVHKARYYNAPDLSNSFFGQANEVVDELQRHPVIILDELDKVHWQTAAGAAWAREQFQRIFDHRYRNFTTHGLVIATNQPPQWYAGDLHFIQSRMLDQRFECIRMTGDNRPFAGDLE